MGASFNSSERERWQAALKAKGGNRPHSAMGKQTGKGIGPNKACGHKGGICRQGSKRG